MDRRFSRLAVVVVATLVAVVGHRLASGQSSASKTTVTTRAAAASVDLTGWWRLDPRLSDALPDSSLRRSFGRRGGAWGGGRGGDGGRGRGWRGGSRPEGGPPPGGDGGPPPEGRGESGPPQGGPEGAGRRGGSDGRRPGGGRPLGLPLLMHVTQTDQLVSFEDSTGSVIREISTTPVDSAAHAPGAPVIAGHWNGGELTAQRAGARGSMTEIIGLEPDGEHLVIRTRFDGRDSTRMRELKRVYRKVTEW